MSLVKVWDIPLATADNPVIGIDDCERGSGEDYRSSVSL